MATKYPIFNVISISIGLFLVHGTAFDIPEYVPVASYATRPTDLSETVGKRVAAILHEHKIDRWVYGSVGLTVAVPVDRAAEARRLLTVAIKAEGLRIRLIDLQSTKPDIIK